MELIILALAAIGFSFGVWLVHSASSKATGKAFRSLAGKNVLRLLGVIAAISILPNVLDLRGTAEVILLVPLIALFFMAIPCLFVLLLALLGSRIGSSLPPGEAQSSQ